VTDSAWLLSGNVFQVQMLKERIQQQRKKRRRDPEVGYCFPDGSALNTVTTI
jgi:hypothetical protein